jgi:hypothetical protein
MSNQLRTLLRHERSPVPPGIDRGARHWSAIQVMSSTWFFVESCEEFEGEIQRWVTASIREAVNIQKGLAPARWARIFVCLRAPSSIREATLFEEVDEAYQVEASNSHLFRLINGMSFLDGSEATQLTQSEPMELKLLYNRRTSQ